MVAGDGASHGRGLGVDPDLLLGRGTRLLEGQVLDAHGRVRGFLGGLGLRSSERRPPGRPVRVESHHAVPVADVAVGPVSGHHVGLAAEPRHLDPVRVLVEAAAASAGTPGSSLAAVAVALSVAVAGLHNVRVGDGGGGDALGVASVHRGVAAQLPRPPELDARPGAGDHPDQQRQQLRTENELLLRRHSRTACEQEKSNN